MRISGGAARGVSLQVPKGDAVRPATDSLRQAVFSSLGARVSGARFADLFAGSGAYGLEAFSRGAAGGVFVEKNAKAASCIQTNLAAVARSAHFDPAALRVIQMDALTWEPDPAALPNLVFIDPPYELIETVALRLFERLDRFLTIEGDPLIVFEMPGELTFDPAGWACAKRLGKGGRQPTAAIFRRA